MSLNQIFSKFNELKILIIGDIMLDAYDWGKVERISPEAPVPVVNLSNTEFRLGGAANVAVNIAAMGAKPIICSVIGNDINGKDLKKLLKLKKISIEGISESDSRPTTVKRRIISGSQQLLRIDHEVSHPLEIKDLNLLLKNIEHLLPTCSAVIFEDYDKGVIANEVINFTKEICKKLNIPIAVDPKKRNFLSYSGVTLFKPNLKELKEGLNINFSLSNNENLEKSVNQLHAILKADSYLITLSERGVLFKNNDTFEIIPAHKREIADVSGAGDTVISIATLCMALNLDIKITAQLSNLAGGLVCEHVGVVPIDKKELLKEALKL
jgi:rfaE bifunctional protein kinase chain/domain